MWGEKTGACEQYLWGSSCLDNTCSKENHFQWPQGSCKKGLTPDSLLSPNSFPGASNLFRLQWVLSFLPAFSLHFFLVLLGFGSSSRSSVAHTPSWVFIIWVHRAPRGWEILAQVVFLHAITIAGEEEQVPPPPSMFPELSLAPHPPPRTFPLSSGYKMIRFFKNGMRKLKLGLCDQRFCFEQWKNKPYPHFCFSQDLKNNLGYLGSWLFLGTFQK